MEGNSIALLVAAIAGLLGVVGWISKTALEHVVKRRNGNGTKKHVEPEKPDPRIDLLIEMVERLVEKVERLVQQHDHPDDYNFGTRRTNELVSSIKESHEELKKMFGDFVMQYEWERKNTKGD